MKKLIYPFLRTTLLLGSLCFSATIKDNIPVISHFIPTFVSTSHASQYAIHDLYRLELQKLVNQYGFSHYHQDMGVFDYVLMDIDGNGVEELFVSYQHSLKNSGFSIYKIENNSLVLLFQNNDLYLPDATGPFMNINKTATSGYLGGRDYPDTASYLCGWLNGEFQCISDIPMTESEQTAYDREMDALIEENGYPSMMGSSFVYSEIISQRLPETKMEVIDTEALLFGYYDDKHTETLRSEFLAIGVEEGGIILPSSVSGGAIEIPTISSKISVETEDSTNINPIHNTKTPTTQGTIAQSYQAVLQHYVDKYGISSNGSVGVASSHYLDIDGDGKEELVLAYCTKADAPTELNIEIWESSSGTATRTFQYSHQQNIKTSADWRDICSLYPYNNRWIFYFAGGGGQDHYESYDKVYSYENQVFTLLESDQLLKQTYDKYVYYTAELNGETYRGSGENATLSSAIPEWYTGFQRIQNTYLSGTPIELFHTDKNSNTWYSSSCENTLNQLVADFPPSQTEAEVVIPTENNTSNLQLATSFKEISDTYATYYGISSGKDQGLVQSHLLDFTGDGQPELFVAYCSRSDFEQGVYYPNVKNYQQYITFHYEIWEMQNASAVKIHDYEYECQISQPDGWGFTHYLVKKDGVWMIYVDEYQATDYFHEGDSIIAYVDGRFQEILNLSHGGGYDSEDWTVNNQNATMETYENEHKNMGDTYFSSGKYEIFQFGVGFDWQIGFCTSRLMELIGDGDASDHYYGLPVIFDDMLKNSIESTLDLGGTILALYQAKESTFYAIVDVNGVQQGRLIEKTGEDSYEILQTSSENLSLSSIEAEIGHFSSGSNFQANSSSENENSDAKTSENSFDFMSDGLPYLCMILGGGLLGFAIMPKKGK